MYDKKVLGLAEAQVAIQAVLEDAAKDPSQPISVAIADDKGDLISLARMDGAPETTTEMAVKKAYSAAKVRGNTRDFGQHRRKSEYGDLEPIPPDKTIIPGGVAIIKPGEQRVVYGGIGTSGTPAERDEELAFIGLKALQDFLWPSK
jgi:glc operon protein GlcG